MKKLAKQTLKKRGTFRRKILCDAVLTLRVVGPAAVFHCLSCCERLRRHPVDVAPSFPKVFLAASPKHTKWKTISAGPEDK